MNINFKLGAVKVKGIHDGAPLDVTVENIEFGITDISLREIPQALNAVKDMVSQLDNESFERELIREDIYRNNACPASYSAINRPVTFNGMVEAIFSK